MAYEDGKIHHVNGIDLYVQDEGKGDAVLLMHGFPDTGYLWRKQIHALVTEGYRVITPDMRGRGQTSVLPEVDDYSILNVTEDMRSLLDELEIEKAHVIGHDFGSVAAWAFASFYAPRTISLVAMSVGHPGSFMKPNPQQLARSWYMMLFQFKGVAEKLITANDWALFRQSVGKSAPEVDRYVEDLSRPGRLTAALNWYRANAAPSNFLSDSKIDWPTIELPVMGMWSEKDFALTEAQMTGSAEFVTDWRYERFEGLGHWFLQEEPDHTNDLLLEFLAKASAQ